MYSNTAAYQIGLWLSKPPKIAIKSEFPIKVPERSHRRSQPSPPLMPAFTLSTAVKRPGESLAVPTWYYGHEPTTPCATKIGKYFQNSLREDGLITIAHGIVFAPGKAGTLQEIFQDAVRNYYRTPPNPFSPMVFYDKTYWTLALPAAPAGGTLHAQQPRPRLQKIRAGDG
jgi:hypothetical protein